MMSWDVCRICLAGNIKMHSISNTQLQDIYEKLTGNQWIKDRRPASICYICHSQLNKSQKFKEMCKLSEEVFSQLFAGGFEFTEETVPILNKRKLQKMLVTPIETMDLCTFSENGIIVKQKITKKKEQHVPVFDNRERQLQKLVTPVTTDTIGTFSDGNSKIESMQILNENKLQKLLVIPVETPVIGNISKDADEIQSRIIDVKKQKLQRLLVSPVETATIGTLLDDNDKIESKQNLIKNKLQKLLVTPVETAMVGTFSKDTDEIQSMNDLKQQKLRKLLVTPVVYQLVGTFYQNTVVKAEIITPKDEPALKLEAPTIEKMDTKKNCPRGPQEKDHIENNSFSDDIVLYIPSHETIEISSSNEDKKTICKVKSEITELPVTYKTDMNISDSDLKISKCEAKTELNNDQSSQDNDVKKRFPCITLRFKINDKTHRNSQSDTKQSRTRKREYPFENVNANGDSLYVCKYCDKTFLVKYRLEKHMVCHGDEKPFACNTCDRTYNVRSLLELHKKIHTGDKQFPCTRCHKSFHRLCYLNRHLKIHDKEKLYKCAICQKSFKELVTLKQHERTHTHEKPYACDECDKRFNQLSNLIQHKRLHTGEKPYSCEYCYKAFHQKSNLLQHSKRYHFTED